MTKKISKNHEGFTLVEIIIVVAIIGILAAISVPIYMNHVTQTKRDSALAVLEQFPVLLETYRAENGSFPSDGTYTYSEDSSGGVSADNITTAAGAGLTSFKPRKATQPANEPIIYSYQLTVANSGTTSENASMVAIPDTSRGAPTGNLSATYQ